MDPVRPTDRLLSGKHCSVDVICTSFWDEGTRATTKAVTCYVRTVVGVKWERERQRGNLFKLYLTHQHYAEDLVIIW